MLERGEKSGDCDGRRSYDGLVFQCFEDNEFLHVHAEALTTSLVLSLQPFHAPFLALLGPLFQIIYKPGS
jgi:hypothetical protein